MDMERINLFSLRS